MSIRATIKQNPAMAVLTSIAAVAIAVVAIAEGIDLADSLVMSEAEAGLIHTAMNTQIADVGKKIDTQANLSECRYLDDKIDRLDYEIYILKRDEAGADYIRSKEVQLRKHRDKYISLECVSIL